MDLSELSDETLLGKVEALAETERFSLIDLLLHLGELDQRDACQKRGYSSVFAYLTRRLGYAESDAIRRVRTARAARKYPSILRMLASGELHLVSVAMLEPLLTSENHERLLRRASRRSTREVERLVAELAPAEKEPRDRIRALPTATSSQDADPPAAAAPQVGAALSPAFELFALSNATVPQKMGDRRVVFTFSAGEQVQEWFETARDLLRHRFPLGRLEDVVGEALRRLVEEELPGKLVRSKEPMPSSSESRHIPKRVQDEVWRRDSGRCAYIGSDGVRCGETAWLEWDHVVPFAWGGPSNDPANIRLLCRSHNQSEARRLFGVFGDQ
ncbi:MAG: hypothetical protein NTY77_17010 [Elusimicrobia bacterium]|nr:hypothetical protein [Elusimicrobiota bacterium]